MVSGRFLANRRHDFTYGANDCVGSFHRNTMPTVGHEHLTSATRTLCSQATYQPPTATSLGIDPDRIDRLEPIRSRKQADRRLLPYFLLPLSCGTMQVAVPVTSLPARSSAVTVR